MKTVFITGADRGIGFAFCRIFLKNGWHVIAGRYLKEWDELDKLKEESENLDIVSLDVSDSTSIQAAVEQTKKLTDRVDMLINVAGIILGDSPREIRAMLQVNSVGPVNMTQAFLPLMEGGMKRLCYVSSEAGSISLAHRKDAYGYGMSKAALNMAVKLMFNTLRKEGFTFRLYHPGWVNTYMEGAKQNIAPYEAEDTAVTAYKTFTEERRSEDVLVMTDINE
jgi:NAD(P)-dependent dehydrogenase (short-subunit alcohol dehydrogenase family)